MIGKMVDQEDRITELADSMAIKFMEIDYTATGFNPGVFDYAMKQAIFGFRAKREITLRKRMETDQKLRAIKMAIDNTKDREAYIRATGVGLLPELKSRPTK